MDENQVLEQQALDRYNQSQQDIIEQTSIGYNIIIRTIDDKEISFSVYSEQSKNDVKEALKNIYWNKTKTVQLLPFHQPPHFMGANLTILHQNLHWFLLLDHLPRNMPAIIYELTLCRQVT